MVMVPDSSKVKSVSHNLAKRKAGRPRSDQLQGKELKEHVLAAASLVYGKWGYHECSVDKIAKEAGISRPLFYRLFESKDQVLDILVQRCNDKLIESTKQATAELNDFFAILDASIDAYFDWCLNNKTIVTVIYREINDPLSPACKQYQNTLEIMLRNHMRNFAKTNLKPFKTELVLTLSKTVEFAGSAIIQTEPHDEELVDLYKGIARRVVFAALADDDEKAKVPPLATVLVKQN